MGSNCGPVRSGIALKEPTEYSSKNGELNATSRWSSATSRSPRRAPAYSGGSSYARLQRHVARADAARARWRHAAHPAEEHPAVRAGVHLVVAWAGRVVEAGRAGRVHEVTEVHSIKALVARYPLPAVSPGCALGCSLWSHCRVDEVLLRCKLEATSSYLRANACPGLAAA
eukprot:scaffold143297_cov136-Phaeocystis_antarctica.AAC.2